MADTASTPLDEFLGYGIVQPFQRDKKNDFANAGGKRLVQSSVGQILGTEAQGSSSHGELPWRPAFGSQMHLLRHRKGPIVKELGSQYARDALKVWAPRVQVTNIVPQFDPLQRIASFKVTASLIDENRPGNYVLIDGVDVEIPII